jgi:copper transporter 1
VDRTLLMIFIALISVVSASCVPSDLSCLKNVTVSTYTTDLCNQMSGMPGCSLKASCKTTKSNCNEEVIYSTICNDMPGMRGCVPFKTLCQNTPVCDQIPTSKAVTKNIYSICTEMSMPGCEVCKINENSGYSECDLIGTYSYLCEQMPGMYQCADYHTMCRNDSTLPWCTKKTPVMRMYFVRFS